MNPETSANWIDLAINALNEVGISFGSIDTLATWEQEYCANAVYRIDNELYLKVFGPTAQKQFHIERSVLQTLKQYPAIPAPRIRALGDAGDRPPYLILGAIPGSTAEHVWHELGRSDQLAIARELGEITMAIHGLPQDDLAEVEGKFGGREAQIELERPRRLAEIQAARTLSLQSQSELARFIIHEAVDLLNGPTKLTHFDLAHNHIYLSQASGSWHVTGIIDWAESRLGPPEWDFAYLWHWSFTRDRVAMQTCLEAAFSDRPLPERFARRCLAALMTTFSMSLLWPYFVEEARRGASIVQEMTEFYFPPEVFGPSD